MSKEASQKKVINRLRTIKGHIAGIEKMVEEGKCCDDVLVQIAAVKSSINKVGVVILEEYAMNCLFDDDKEEMDKEQMEKIIKSILNYSK